MSGLPVRSISLPARLDHHPQSLKVEADLNRLKACWNNPSSCLTDAGAIQNGLVSLASLYTSVDELIHSPLTQQASDSHHNLVEAALDESIRLLDDCSSARDLFATMRENLREIQSALRRKDGVSSIQSEIQSYLRNRKKLKKDIIKCLRSLKQTETSNSIRPLPSTDSYHHLAIVIRILHEVISMTIAIFRSMLSFLSVPKTNLRASRWSLISKLMLTGASEATNRSEKIANEVVSADFALHALQGCIKKSSCNAKFDVQTVQKKLEKLDVTIKSLEEGANCLFRCLIQYRVSLLNVIAS